MKWQNRLIPKPYQFPRLKNSQGEEIADSEFCNWETLSKKRGGSAGKLLPANVAFTRSEKGTLGQIFTKAQNKVQDPAKLLKIIDMIGLEHWMMIGADVKGDIYEGLLERTRQIPKVGQDNTLPHGL